jgi:hypothetical protein
MSDNGLPGKPGVPPNPEQDSEGHVWTVDGVMEIYKWVASKQWYEDTRGHWFSPTCIEGDDYYHGRIVTPAEVESRIKEAEAKIAAGCLISNAAEVADLVAQAKRDALIKAAARVSNYAVTAHQHGSLPIDPHQCAKQVAWEITASITAMAEKDEGND